MQHYRVFELILIFFLGRCYGTFDIEVDHFIVILGSPY